MFLDTNSSIPSNFRNPHTLKIINVQFSRGLHGFQFTGNGKRKNLWHDSLICESIPDERNGFCFGAARCLPHDWRSRLFFDILVVPKVTRDRFKT